MRQAVRVVKFVMVGFVAMIVLMVIADYALGARITMDPANQGLMGCVNLGCLIGAVAIAWKVTREGKKSGAGTPLAKSEPKSSAPMRGNHDRGN